jgi:hypothetical protein
MALSIYSPRKFQDFELQNTSSTQSSVHEYAQWSSGHGSWLQTQRSRVRFPALPDFLSSGSGMRPTSPRKDK